MNSKAGSLEGPYLNALSREFISREYLYQLLIYAICTTASPSPSHL